MKRYMDLVNEALEVVDEVFPWDLAEELAAGEGPLLLDVREPYEFDRLHIQGSLNVPRGVLEQACERDQEETVERLVDARDQDVVVICRSGHRSALAGKVMQEMGYRRIRSLKTGIRGWNDYEQPMVGRDGRQVPIEEADEVLMPLDQRRALERQARNAA